MYLVFTDKADEFTRIKAILGPDAHQANSRHNLLEILEKESLIRVIVVAASVKSESAFALSAELRVTHPRINVILVRDRIDVPTLTASLESGIKDVIDSKDATGLVNAVERCESVSERIESMVAEEEGRKVRGKVIVVYSAKGGCGKTTISSNLAAALAEDGVTRVCLVDLDLQFGDIATALRVAPMKTISDALSRTLQNDGPLNWEEVSHAVTSYQERFDLLLAPSNPVDIENISPEFVSRVITSLQNRYDFIIIDTSPSMSEVIVKTLQESDLALLVTTLDMPAIKNLRLTISALDALGFPASRRMLVLNHADLRVGLEPHDVEELIGESISVSIPSSTKVSLATNRGELIINLYPGNGVSKAILKLAREVRRMMNEQLEVKVA